MSPMRPTPLTVEWSLLGFLHEDPTHGYDLYQKLADSEGLGLVWYLKQSQLYATLAKLEDRGYVRYDLEQQEARPPRKVYELTEMGHRALLEWLQQPVEHGREFRMEFLAKIYFARKESESQVQQLIERQRDLCQEWLEAQNDEAQGLRESDPYEWLVYQFRAGQIEAMLDWLDLCEETLQMKDETIERRDE